MTNVNIHLETLLLVNSLKYWLNEKSDNLEAETEAVHMINKEQDYLVILISCYYNYSYPPNHPLQQVSWGILHI